MQDDRGGKRSRVIRNAVLLALAAAGVYLGYIALLFYLGSSGAAG